MATTCEMIKLEITAQSAEEAARDQKMAALLADGWTAGPFWSISEENQETGEVKLWFLIMMIPPPPRIEAVAMEPEPVWRQVVVAAVGGLTATIACSAVVLVYWMVSP